MTNFLFFLLGLIVGGLVGIVMMCMCIIARKSDDLIENQKNNSPESQEK